MSASIKGWAFAPEVASGIAAGATGYVFARPADAALFRSLPQEGAPAFATAPYYEDGLPPASFEGAKQLSIVVGNDQQAALAISGQLRALAGEGAIIAAYRAPLGDFAGYVREASGILGRQPSTALVLSRLELVDFTAAPRPRNALDVLNDEENLMERFLSSPAAPLAWVVQDLLPQGAEVGLIAPGGTGKGLFEVDFLALHVALGVDFGPFKVPAPRGVLYLALEDSKETLHRRVEAAVRVHFPDLSEEQRAALKERVHFKALRGTHGAVLNDEFVQGVIDAARRVPDLGLIMLDPLTRALDSSKNVSLNTQEAGSYIVQLTKIAVATGATVLFAHHTNKRAIQEGRTLERGAQTGSQQLEDLPRAALQMAQLTRAQAESYRLPTEGGRRYVEIRLTKENDFHLTGGPYVMELLPQGVLDFVTVDPDARVLTAEEHVFEEIARLCQVHGRPVTGDEVKGALRGRLGQNEAQAAWARLVTYGELNRKPRAVEVGDSRKDGLEPAPGGQEKLAARLAQGASRKEAQEREARAKPAAL